MPERPERPVGKPLVMPVYRCSWCLQDTPPPFDCPCCGSAATRRIAASCEHRRGSTVSDLWARGVRLVRREPWSDGSYLELEEDADGGMSALGLAHGPLAWPGVPEQVRIPTRWVPFWMTPMGGWEPYTGPAVGAGAHPELRPRGERNGRAKLTAAAVRVIRRRYATGGVSQQALANEFGVARSLIGPIIRREAWTHVT